MLQAVRGAQYPLVTVRFRIPDTDTDRPSFNADLEVSFAGQTVHYPGVPFHQQVRDREHHITGVVPATVSDFHISPQLLTLPNYNEIPLRVDSTSYAQ